MKEGLTSGQVAQQADVNVQTVRYYERRKLLPRPPRTEGGFRLYPAHVVGQVRFIKRAQGLGFSLIEIEDLLRLSGTGAKCNDVKQRVERKIADVDQKIAELQKLRSALAGLTRTCSDPDSDCPVLAQLDVAGPRGTRSTR